MKIDVPPLERERFPDSHSCPYQQQDERIIRGKMFLACLQYQRHFLTGQEGRFLLLLPFLVPASFQDALSGVSCDVTIFHDQVKHG
jgi:hypothetical protein